MACLHKIHVLTAALALALTSAAPPRHLSPCIHGNFNGITQTLPDGTIVGEPDRRDWGCVGGGSTSDALLAVPRGPGIATPPPLPPPTAVCLDPAAPNPAEVATVLRFTLPSAAHLSLAVYGRNQGGGPRETFVARALLEGEFAAGSHSVAWDLNDDQGSRVPPGVYRVILVAGDDALCGDIEVR